MLEPAELINDAMIKAIGVDGDGSNAVGHMMRERTEGVEFFVVNIDVQALYKTVVGQTIQIGSDTTEGLGADVSPKVGRNAADEDRDTLCAVLEGVDIVLTAAGMSGDTGTDAAPIVTEVAEGLNILTVTVITKPFNFEGKEYMTFAERGVIELSKHVSSLITIPNDKLPRVLDRGTSLPDVFGTANDVLKGTVRGITELITRPGLVNADFADVHTVMSEMDYIVMGFGVASSEDRVGEATEMAIPSPLLEGIDLSGTHGVLASITADSGLRLDEFETVGSTIHTLAFDNATVVIGTSLDPDMNDGLRVAVVVTGIGIDKRPKIILMINKQVRQPVMDRYQQHGMAPLTQEQRPVARVMNGNMPQTVEKSDYLDIPTFLCKWAD